MKKLKLGLIAIVVSLCTVGSSLQAGEGTVTVYKGKDDGAYSDGKVCPGSGAKCMEAKVSDLKELMK
jgi:hypothetical protein